MKNVILIIILFIVSTKLAFSSTSCSDYCDFYHYFETTIEKIADYDAVFIGSIHQGSYFKSTISNGKVEIKVTKVFKGKLKKIETVNFSYFGSFGVRRGEKYLIFAKYNQQGELYTNECDGSSKVHNGIMLKMRSFDIDSLEGFDNLDKKIAIKTKRNINFLNGLLKQENGHVKFYFYNGQIMSEGEWKDGRPINKWKHYDKNGQLRSEGFYNSHGKKIGTWKKISSVEHRLERTENKVILLMKGFEIEYETYNDEGIVIKYEYELYDLNHKLLLDKERKTCEKGYNEYYVIDDKE